MPPPEHPEPSSLILPAGPSGHAPAPPRPKPQRGFDTRGIRQGCARGRRRSRRGGGGGGSRAAPGWAAASHPGEGREGGGQVGRAGRAVRGEPGPFPRERGGPGGAVRGAADPRPQLIPAAPRQLPQPGRSRGPACPHRHRAPRPGRAWSPRRGERPFPLSLRSAGPAGRRRREEPLGPARGRGRGGGSGGCSLPAARTAQQGAAGAAPARERGAAGSGEGGGPRCGQLPPIPPAAAPGLALPGCALPELSLGRRLQPGHRPCCEERPQDRASPEPGRRERGRQQRRGPGTAGVASPNPRWEGDGQWRVPTRGVLLPRGPCARTRG